jgi:hypothetical protein
MELVKMATEKKQTASNPLIQIDDLVREMTNEEYAEYLQMKKDCSPIVIPE